jgi:hypothetical protein
MPCFDSTISSPAAFLSSTTNMSWNAELQHQQPLSSRKSERHQIIEIHIDFEAFLFMMWEAIRKRVRIKITVTI